MSDEERDSMLTQLVEKVIILEEILKRLTSCPLDHEDVEFAQKCVWCGWKNR